MLDLKERVPVEVQGGSNQEERVALESFEVRRRRFHFTFDKILCLLTQPRRLLSKDGDGRLLFGKDPRCVPRVPFSATSSYARMLRLSEWIWQTIAALAHT